MLEKVEKVYFDFSQCKLNSDKACKQILEYIFLYPHKFGISKLNEDDRSDFLLFFFNQLPKILKNYSPKLSSFSTYLINNVKNLKKSWYRTFYRRHAQAESIDLYCKQDSSIFANDDEETYHTCNIQYSIKSNRDAFKILVLGLKSSYYLTANHIALLSEVTGISIDKISEYKHALDLTIEKKIDRYKKEIEKKNKAFIQKNRCSIELEYVNKQTCLAEHIEKSQSYYTRVWYNALREKSIGKVVRPSNSAISKVLNVREHLIYHALHELKHDYLVEQN